MKIKFILLFLFLFSCMDKEFKRDEIDDISLNKIQVLGTHNSYSLPIDSIIKSISEPRINKVLSYYLKNLNEEQITKYKEFHPNEINFMDGLSYSFPDFKKQLDFGLRSLELDVYYDPNGGLFSKPASFKFLEKNGYSLKNVSPFDSTPLKDAGFKIMHIPDVDFRSHYPTFKDALLELKQWSELNKGHLPIFILIEAKDSNIPVFPESTNVLPYDKKAFIELDQEILAYLGREKLIIPDDVQGEYETLNEAIRLNGWPSINESRDKFLFLLIPSGGGITENKNYFDEKEGLKNKIMFIRSEPGKKHSAFLLLDNAIVRGDDIKRYVKEGYLVRTRADIETYEAKINDFSRAKKAISSGAQIISTDFYKQGNSYGTSYKVSFPGNKTWRLNPIFND